VAGEDPRRDAAAGIAQAVALACVHESEQESPSRQPVRVWVCEVTGPDTDRQQPAVDALAQACGEQGVRAWRATVAAARAHTLAPATHRPGTEAQSDTHVLDCLASGAPRSRRPPPAGLLCAEAGSRRSEGSTLFPAIHSLCITRFAHISPNQAQAVLLCPTRGNRILVVAPWPRRQLQFSSLAPPTDDHAHRLSTHAGRQRHYTRTRV
jgi:hypothetical protein